MAKTSRGTQSRRRELCVRASVFPKDTRNAANPSSGKCCRKINRDSNAGSAMCKCAFEWHKRAFPI